MRIGIETAEGLAAAHDKQLIHRDIKPGNIWLEGKRARVKILDFGLARSASDAGQLTQSGAKGVQVRTLDVCFDGNMVDDVPTAVGRHESTWG